MIWHSSEASEVLNELSSNPAKGLANGVADMRLEQYGKNTVTGIKKPTFLKRFLSQLNNKYVYLLIASAIASFILSLIYDEKNLYSPLLIIAIVLLNALISAYHLYRGDNALNMLKNITNPTATVIRDGILRQISASLLVPGDIICLKEGDYISADARIIESDGFRCNESTLTGESIPVVKNSEAVTEDITPLNKRSDMVYSGCSVVHGTAKAVVVETGINTELGHSASIIRQTGADKLPLQSALDNTGKIVNIIILIFCSLTFIIGIIQKFHTASFANMTAKTFMNFMALAVCAIPEGLPAISTIVIALGIKRIVSDDIIIKKTDIIETLGKTTVICSDKTGVLTKNNMTLHSIFDGEHFCNLYTDKISDKNAVTLRLAATCSTLENDATEAAIKEACIKYNSMSQNDVENIFPRLGVIPFNSERKTMTSINMINGRPVAIVKGAPEIIIEKCHACDKKAVLAANDSMTAQALRVVCIAIKELNEIPANPNAEEIECSLTFAGLLGIKDPPRRGAIDGISACKNAGIKTVMITGDNLSTASAIAQQIGILKKAEQSITGTQLNELDDAQLAQKISDYTVFARVSPNDKLRIIKAFQSIGETVTVTGNSIADSEALAVADIGCSMGEDGTDVAKGSADIIISNNSFSSVVRAIKESRGMFINIRNAVFYLLSCNFGELLAYLIGMLIFGMPPIAAVPLLWINLLIDCAPAMALSIDKPQDDVMLQHPEYIFKHILNIRGLLSMACQALYIAAITLTAFLCGKSGGTALSSTMAFTTLGIAQLLHTFNIRAPHSIFKTKFNIDEFIGISSVITIFTMLFIVLTPVGAVFGLEILTTSQLAVSIALAISVIPFCEFLKLIQSFLLKRRGF